MKPNQRVPFMAILAVDLAVVVLGGSVVLWFAQDIIVKALQFVVPVMVS